MNYMRVAYLVARFIFAPKLDVKKKALRREATIFEPGP